MTIYRIDQYVNSDWLSCTKVEDTFPFLPTLKEGDWQYDLFGKLTEIDWQNEKITAFIFANNSESAIRDFFYMKYREQQDLFESLLDTLGIKEIPQPSDDVITKTADVLEFVTTSTEIEKYFVYPFKCYFKHLTLGCAEVWVNDHYSYYLSSADGYKLKLAILEGKSPFGKKGITK